MFKRVAITGGDGRLGKALADVYGDSGHEVLRLPHHSFDITKHQDLEELSAWGPDLILNCAAWTDVDGCARSPEAATAINGHGAGAVAAVAARAGAAVIQISTNEVFDGCLDDLCAETDDPNPKSAYGRSKLIGETLVAASGAPYLIIRTAWLFGPTGPNFVTKILGAASVAASRGEKLRVVTDEWGNPTWIPRLADDIANNASRLIDAGIHILHLAGTPAITRYGWAERILRGVVELEPTTLSAFPRDSEVPDRAVLCTKRALALEIRPNDWMEPTLSLVQHWRDEHGD